MIKTRQDLKRYMEQDARALNIIDRKRPKFFGDEIWKFQILLRKCEFYTNIKKAKRLFLMPAYVITRYRFKVLSLKLGFSIPLNVFE